MRVRTTVFAPALSLGLALALLSGCGPTPEQQAAMDAAQRAQDQQKCAGFGFAPQSDGFAHCMLQISQQREADAAAERRAAADRAAADQRARATAQAAKDKADQDAWDRRTGQGAYSSSNAASPASSPSAGHAMRDLGGMNCTSNTTTTGSSNNSVTTTNTNCHN